MPSLAHGDTSDRPKPAPKISSIKESVAVADAPANTAPQETALPGEVVGLAKLPA